MRRSELACDFLCLGSEDIVQGSGGAVALLVASGFLCSERDACATSVAPVEQSAAWTSFSSTDDVELVEDHGVGGRGGGEGRPPPQGWQRGWPQGWPPPRPPLPRGSQPFLEMQMLECAAPATGLLDTVHMVSDTPFPMAFLERLDKLSGMPPEPKPPPEPLWVDKYAGQKGMSSTFGKLLLGAGITAAVLAGAHILENGTIETMAGALLAHPIGSLVSAIGSGLAFVGKGLAVGANMLGKGLVAGAKMIGKGLVASAKVIGSGLWEGTKMLAKGLLAGAKMAAKFIGDNASVVGKAAYHAMNMLGSGLLAIGKLTMKGLMGLGHLSLWLLGGAGALAGKVAKGLWSGAKMLGKGLWSGAKMLAKGLRAGTKLIGKGILMADAAVVAGAAWLGMGLLKGLAMLGRGLIEGTKATGAALGHAMVGGAKLLAKGAAAFAKLAADAAGALAKGLWAGVKSLDGISARGLVRGLGVTLLMGTLYMMYRGRDDAMMTNEPGWGHDAPRPGDMGDGYRGGGAALRIGGARDKGKGIWNQMPPPRPMVGNRFFQKPSDQGNFYQPVQKVRWEQNPGAVQVVPTYQSPSIVATDLAENDELTCNPKSFLQSLGRQVHPKVQFDKPLDSVKVKFVDASDGKVMWEGAYHLKQLGLLDRSAEMDKGQPSEQNVTFTKMCPSSDDPMPKEYVLTAERFPADQDDPAKNFLGRAIVRAWTVEKPPDKMAAPVDEPFGLPEPAPRVQTGGLSVSSFL